MKHLIQITGLIFLFGCNQVSAYGQSKPFVSNPKQLNDSSFAEWIGPMSDAGYSVYYFRKHLILQTVPPSFIVHVSADNRYRLYVNGSLVSWGPAVGDLENWNYETVDISPYLKKGENIIASQVWNMGILRGPRQISSQTAFILQGESKTEQMANTNKTWLTTIDAGYFGIRMTDNITGSGYVAGGTDSVVGAKHPWGWEKNGYDDVAWGIPDEIGKGNHKGLNTWRGTAWKLKPREIPTMEQKLEPIPNLLSVEGINYHLSEYNGSLSMNVPANKHTEILLDNGILTMGFPQLMVSGGKGSKVKLQYQEALFDKNGNKGNRSEWKGKEMKGYYDVFIPDGGVRLFEPLWVRTFRYVKLTIDTKDEALTINSFNNKFTAYPFEQKACFLSNDSSLQKIWDVSWHTARLCALETYMDCPYYEQLQYIGDTRIQALLSMYVTGDDRLAKNAIRQIYSSMQPMGLTKSNHPCKDIQIIPPFSLLYICMVHDYYMMRDDPEFIGQLIPGIKFILEWFVGRMDNSDMVGPLPYWNYVDASPKEFQEGSPPGITEGHSALMSVLLAYTLDRASQMFTQYGYQCDADYYQKMSEKLKSGVIKTCFDKRKGLIAETPEKEIFSQHTNSLAILANMFDLQTARSVGKKMIEDSTIAKAGLYFDFYVFQALRKVGMGNQLLKELDKWKFYTDRGCTTFPEGGLQSRSDCHAWSAHPMYDLLNITCGFEPAEPGFKTITIAPQVGTLKEINCKFPHPLGECGLTFDLDNHGRRRFEISLPNGLKGNFIFDNKTFEITSGKSLFEF